MEKPINFFFLFFSVRSPYGEACSNIPFMNFVAIFADNILPNKMTINLNDFSPFMKDRI